MNVSGDNSIQTIKIRATAAADDDNTSGQLQQRAVVLYNNASPKSVPWFETATTVVEVAGAHEDNIEKEEEGKKGKSVEEVMMWKKVNMDPLYVQDNNNGGDDWRSSVKFQLQCMLQTGQFCSTFNPWLEKVVVAPQKTIRELDRSGGLYGNDYANPSYVYAYAYASCQELKKEKQKINSRDGQSSG